MMFITHLHVFVQINIVVVFPCTIVHVVLNHPPPHVHLSLSLSLSLFSSSLHISFCRVKLTQYIHDVTVLFPNMKQEGVSAQDQTWKGWGDGRTERDAYLQVQHPTLG